MSTISKSKLDEVLEEYESLTVPERNKFFEKIIHAQQGSGTITFYVYSIQDPNPKKFPIKDKLFNSTGKAIRPLGRHKRSGKNTRKLPALYSFQNTIIQIEENKFINQPENFWRLVSLFGKEHILKKLKENKPNKLNDRFINSIFKDSKFNFYVDKTGEYLFAHRNELYESDFGPLDELTALEALNRFGLDRLENAKEKGYIKI